MITSRTIEESDQPLIESALAGDTFHPGVSSGVFYAPGTVANVYSDESGPIMFVRGCKSLRIDICFVDNADHVRNKAAIVDGFFRLVGQAKAAGFSEITTSTNGPGLLRFACMSVEAGGLGFELVQTAENGETALRRVL